MSDITEKLAAALRDLVDHVPESSIASEVMADVHEALASYDLSQELPKECPIAEALTTIAAGGLYDEAVLREALMLLAIVEGRIYILQRAIQRTISGLEDKDGRIKTALRDGAVLLAAIEPLYTPPSNPEVIQ